MKQTKELQRLNPTYLQHVRKLRKKLKRAARKANGQRSWLRK